MITPGGSPGTAFSKSATTRFNNTQVDAQQRAMPFNAAAQASLRKQSSASNPSGPAVAPTQNPNDFQVQGSQVGPQQVNLPTGGPVMPEEAVQDFDPAVFQEQALDTLVGSIRTQEFINSPRVKDAATSVRLKNFFNATNPDKREDPRTLFQQVLNRIGVE